jgi:hypothetical protein
VIEAFVVRLIKAHGKLLPSVLFSSTVNSHPHQPHSKTASQPQNPQCHSMVPGTLTSVILRTNGFSTSVAKNATRLMTTWRSLLRRNKIVSLFSQWCWPPLFFSQCPGPRSKGLRYCYRCSNAFIAEEEALIPCREHYTENEADSHWMEWMSG